ncbi:maleylacetate reductase [Paraburkholderia caffeinilytica]|uniref:Maleylacetate reductase n=1 Tax=Paraburkholderia caffeinilytica TaxID=1761016 RepID=A0ABQ1NB06_9BURK|nr:maleylacetate reductase [Paraburkholderia caffeinilytica]AXL53860.1 maleylacetate reductase [Paraburkholderia caffeinilytica]GGC64337.1 maleylacetate reductase [Paraburkholderia caffeinilytica]CAB3800265.1 Maleylacetate reductase [Paraburkholderia caffeinilytica]
MYEFTYTTPASRVVFGAGSMKLIQQEVETLGARRALVLCTPEQRAQAEVISSLLGPSSAGVFDGAQMHVPIENARRAREHAKAVGADCAVAIGGGSTIGLGKAIALESSLPIIAIPTTYAGSEMTPIYGITENGLKQTGRDPKVLPKTVLYDPELSGGLPAHLSFVSGLNAIAHAAEGLYAKDGNPVMSLMAEEGIRALANGLRGVKKSSRDTTARSDCLYGAWLCGMVLGNVGMALHHKLCHTLGGTFNLPHAETHAIVLPHALAYNSIAAAEAMTRIARALDAESAADGLYDLSHELGVPRGLREIGLLESDLDRACEVAMSNPYWNPRPVEGTPLRALLQRAWEGSRPRP